jgi:hypothetical protein
MFRHVTAPAVWLRQWMEGRGDNKQLYVSSPRANGLGRRMKKGPENRACKSSAEKPRRR